MIIWPMFSPGGPPPAPWRQVADDAGPGRSDVARERPEVPASWQRSAEPLGDGDSGGVIHLLVGGLVAINFIFPEILGECHGQNHPN